MASVIRPMRRRTREEKLIDLQFAVEDVAVRRADHRLDIGRRQHLHADDAVGETRRVLVHDPQHVLDEFVLAGCPVAFVQRRAHARRTD